MLDNIDMRMYAAMFLLLFLGCAFSVNSHRDPAAPDVGRSPYAEVIHSPPKDAVRMGYMDVQGNNWQNASDCEARMIIEAREMGANAVLIQPEREGLGQGPKCSGIGYLIKH